MRKIFLFQFLMILFLFFSIPAAATCDCTNEAVTGIPQAECEALVAFHQSAGEWFVWEGSVPVPVDGWRETSPVEDWMGVVVEDGHVTEIDLEDFYSGEGPIPPEIGNLAHLRIFRVDGQHPTLTGSIPPEIGNLAGLEELDLSRNQLSGSIPPEIGNLGNLRVLDLGENNLSGPIPPEIGSLGLLTGLFLRENGLEGEIPSEMGNLGNLERLNISENQLQGEIPPELGNLSSLISLDLDENELDGQIPEELGSLANLESLSLSENSLDGAIPAEIGALTSLGFLDLSANLLSGAIPSEIGNLTSLTSLNLAVNELEGVLPEELGNLVGLDVLQLSANKLSGPVPQSFMNITNVNTKNSFPYYGPTSMIRYNALYTDDPETRAYMDSKWRAWAATQTVEVDNLRARALAPLPWSGHYQESNRVLLQWDPIAFQDYDGGYEVCIKESEEGSCLAQAGITADKEASSMIVTGLEPAREYRFSVTTRSFKHERNRNPLTSSRSAEVSVTAGEAVISAFPLWESGPGIFTGMAFSNYGSSAAGLKLTAWGEEGQKLGTPVNPVDLDVGPGRQMARLGSEFFGVTDDVPRISWVEAASDEMLGSFFTFGSADLRMLDGAATQSMPLQKLYFSTVLESGVQPRYGETEEVNIALVNPFENAVDLKMTVFKRGDDVAELEKTIPAKGMLLATGKELFGEVNLPFECFLEVETTAGLGVIGFSRIDFPESGTTMAVNALAPSSAKRLYSAQLASGPGVGGTGMETHIRLVNPMSETRVITLTAIAEDGSLLAEPVVKKLFPRKVWTYPAWDLFDFQGDFAVGSLVINVDSEGLVGDVIFTPFEGIEYAAAMPLQSRPVKEAVFNHIANSDEIYTGLAFFNPGAEDAEITVVATRADGTVSGTRQVTLGPNQRISRTLKDADMLPGTASQLDGFISISSTRPIICQQLYGSTDLRFLAAVPPTTAYGEMF